MDDLEAFDYSLPEDRIAQSPAEPRDSARLLVCKGDAISHDYRVADLVSLLTPGDLLVFNKTRVRRARIIARRLSGGRCELLFLHPLEKHPSGPVRTIGDQGQSDEHVLWEALARPSRKLSPGQILVPEVCGDDDCVIVIDEELGEGHWVVRVKTESHPVGDFFTYHGAIPLPPYFHGKLESEERYQTVFADKARSAAAPTAGLHFTRKLLKRLDSAGIETTFIDLEIGASTLRPIREGNLANVTLSPEVYEIGENAAAMINAAKERGSAVVAVGTTVVRALESAARDGRTIDPGRGIADLFIRPGYEFAVVDALMTNFHAPRTSMLLMLAAFYPEWKRAYEVALTQGFRFLSFGDSMLVLSD